MAAPPTASLYRRDDTSPNGGGEDPGSGNKITECAAERAGREGQTTWALS